MRRNAKSQLVPNCDAGQADIDPQLVSRFIEAMGRRGVPELGARAVLKQFRIVGEKMRAGKMSSVAGWTRMVRTMLRAEDKAAELARQDIAKIAAAVGPNGAGLDMAIKRVRGAA